MQYITTLFRARYTSLLCLLFITLNSFANHIPNPDDGDVLLIYKSKSDEQLCKDKPFFLKNIDIDLTKDGILSVSLAQVSKSVEGFNTHLTIELLDYKGRILTTYETPTLAIGEEEAGLDNKAKKKNKKEGRVANAYFTENFKYQFSAEEYKIFINNVRQLKVVFNGCDDPNETAEVHLLSRNLPKEIVDEFIHNNTPLVSE